MYRTLAWMQVLSIPLLTVVCCLAILVGRGQAAYHPTMSGFREGCEGQMQPCWHGIIPTVTTVAEVERIMKGMGYVPSHRPSFGSITYGRIDTVIPCTVYVFYRQSTDPILRVVFDNCDELRFGDLLTTLGYPDTVLPSQNLNVIRYRSHTESFLAGKRLSPYSNILTIELRPDYMLQAAIGLPWEGFMPQGHYCRPYLGQDYNAYC